LQSGRAHHEKSAQVHPVPGPEGGGTHIAQRQREERHRKDSQRDHRVGRPSREPTGGDNYQAHEAHREHELEKKRGRNQVNRMAPLCRKFPDEEGFGPERRDGVTEGNH